MRVTLLGHATVLVEVGGANVLIDPVLQDPFGEGMLVACPARRVTGLPRIDLIILTGGRPDHVDVPSLARLSPDATVICPKDSRILYILDRLGFRKVRPTEPSSVIRIAAGVEVVTTQSARKAPEFGVLVKDATGTFWDPVSTALSRPIIDPVLARFGPIDLLLAGYAYPEFGYFGVQRAGFPGPFLRAAVDAAAHVAPRLIVPGSAGFRFAEPFAWTNAFIFPISPQRFVADLGRIAPALATATGNPGDVFEVGHGRVERRPGASPFVAMTADDTERIVYDPSAEVPALSDPNCDGYAAAVLEQQVAATFAELTAFLCTSYEADPAIAEQRRAGGSYGLGVVFPDGHERWLRVGFDGSTPVIAQGEGPIRGALRTTRIAASVLTARARYERGYPYPGGLTRITRINPARLVDGKVAIEPKEPPELLMHWIRVKPPGWGVHGKQVLDFQIAAALAQPSPAPLVGGAR